MGIAASVGAVKGRWQFLLALAAGATLGLVQAPWSFPIVFFAALPVIFWLHTGAETRRRAAAIGWFVGLGYFGLTLTWIVEPFLVDIARHGWMAPFAWFLMAGGLAIFWAVAFLIAPQGRGLLLAGVWTGIELIRAHIFTGFPWGLIGYGWVDTPVIQLASVVGVHGVGLLTLIGVALLIRGGFKYPLLGVYIFASMWAYGSYRLSQPMELRADKYLVRIVQPNVAQDQKWMPEFQQEFFDRHLELTATAGSPNIVIWPEAAVPFFPDERPDLLQEMNAAAKGAEVVFGARRRDESGDWFNGLVLLDDSGNIAGNYDKHHLVPFGEYVPKEDLLSKTGLSALTGGGFTAGSGPEIIRNGDVPAFLPLICYEAIFPQHASMSEERPDWIVQITNDAWFGQFSGPYQHIAQSRVRAIEQGLPIARSANTGVSGMIDPYGRIMDSLPLGETGTVDVLLPTALPKTVYSRLSEAPYIGFLF